jgi:hypothetical protein
MVYDCGAPLEFLVEFPSVVWHLLTLTFLTLSYQTVRYSSTDPCMNMKHLEHYERVHCQLL